jgi:hypothetical protein
LFVVQDFDHSLVTRKSKYEHFIKKNYFSTRFFYVKILKRQPIDPNKLIYSIKNPKMVFKKILNPT